jgi:hypothetical protein
MVTWSGHDAHHAFLSQQRLGPFGFLGRGIQLTFEPLFESGHGITRFRVAGFRHIVRACRPVKRRTSW